MRFASVLAINLIAQFWRSMQTTTPPDLRRLTDLLPFENSKWIGAERIEEEVKTGGWTESGGNLL